MSVPGFRTTDDAGLRRYELRMGETGGSVVIGSDWSFGWLGGVGGWLFLLVVVNSQLIRANLNGHDY